MDFVDELEKKKRISTLQLLMRCARLANEYSLSRLPETERTDRSVGMVDRSPDRRPEAVGLAVGRTEPR